MKKHFVASELKDPICHSDECQIRSFSSEATICSVGSIEKNHSLDAKRMVMFRSHIEQMIIVILPSFKLWIVIVRRNFSMLTL